PRRPGRFPSFPPGRPSPRRARESRPKPSTSSKGRSPSSASPRSGSGRAACPLPPPCRATSPPKRPPRVRSPTDPPRRPTPPPDAGEDSRGAARQGLLSVAPTFGEASLPTLSKLAKSGLLTLPRDVRAARHPAGLVLVTVETSFAVRARHLHAMSADGPGFK